MDVLSGANNMRKILGKIYAFWHTVLCEFMQTNCMNRAAALSFTSLLSLAPLMAVSFTMLHLFPVFSGLSQKMQAFIFNNFVTTSAQIIQAHLQQFIEQAHHLSLTGFLILVVTAVLMMINVEQSFNAIWRVREQRRRVPAFLLYWAILTFLPTLLGIGILISSYIVALPLFFSVHSFFLATTLLKYVPIVLAFVVFTLLYAAVPNCKVPMTGALLGGIVAAILFEFAKYGFALYITRFPTYALLYGAFAAIPIFLIWVYLSWLVVLFGAVVSHVWASGVQTKSKPVS